MRDSNAQDSPSQPLEFSKQSWLIAGALACVLFGAFMAWSLHLLWQLGSTPVTSTLEEQMMHRKTRTMERILDGLVRGDLGRVERSASRMWEIGQSLDWYLASHNYEDNDKIFRDSTFELIEAARQRNHHAAKESALRMERSCIECHELINRQNGQIP